MSDHFELPPWKSIQAESGAWYRAVELLGVGGNAATFLAYCTTRPRKGLLFAIKVFRKLSKPERRQSFLEEARYLRTCDHPSVMRVFDEGTYYDDNPFVVVEYLPRTLADVMRGHVGILEKVAYAIQLLSAIDYLSSQSPAVLHRDIKPQNIFIKGGSCVLGDFGLMKRLDGKDGDDREIVKESIGPGMPYYYRTPDLVKYLRGEALLSVNSDVFQLGLVLTHLFTGWNPAKPSKDFSADVELEPVGHVPSQFGARLAGLLRLMLEPDPASRRSAGELIDAWEAVFRDITDASHHLEERAFHF
jgi:serine/threonine protein kinase